MGRASREKRVTKERLEPRPVSNPELFAACESAAENLTDGLDRMDRGSVAAARAVAAQVRLAFGGNRGDKLVERACRRFGVPLPLVRIANTTTTGHVPSFALQGLPLDEIPGDGRDGTRTVPLDQWLNSPAVRTSRGGRVETTWRVLLQDIANNYGVHSSAVVPKMLDDFVHFDAGDRGLLWHVIYALGAVAEGALATILTTAGNGSTGTTTNRLLQPGGVELLSIRVDTIDQDGGRVPVEIGFKIRDDTERQILSVPMDGRRMVVSAVRNRESGGLDTNFDWRAPLEPRTAGLR